jgi:hypothetical protein
MCLGFWVFSLWFLHKLSKIPSLQPFSSMYPLIIVHCFNFSFVHVPYISPIFVNLLLLAHSIRSQSTNSVIFTQRWLTYNLSCAHSHHLNNVSTLMPFTRPSTSIRLYLVHWYPMPLTTDTLSYLVPMISHLCGDVQGILSLMCHVITRSSTHVQSLSQDARQV